MPPHQEPINLQNEDPISISILQINLNKSEKAHLDIINEEVSQKYDVMLIQEPYTTKFNAIRTPTNFRAVYPIDRFQNEDQIRSVIWVNKRLDTNDWIILDIPGTNDITAIQLKGPYGKLTIFNVYNDCTHSRNEIALGNYLRRYANIITRYENHHMVWAGDFNRHHPLWDDDEDVHLFTRQALRDAEGLIGLLADYEMQMVLPKGIPTLRHMRTKKYSRPDNVFSTPGLQDFVVKCEVDAALKPTSTDHFPVLTHIQLPQERINTPPSFNFRETDWDEFRRKLKPRLRRSPDKPVITNAEQLNKAVESLTQALQETIQEVVKRSRPRPDSKRWWNGDLIKRRQALYRLRADSYRFRALANHPSHRELRTESNRYGEAIIQAKRGHWTSYLEEMTANEIWTANKYIKEPVGDGGNPRIPTLKVKNAAGAEISISSNEEKAETFVKIFFPPPPPAVAGHEDFEDFEYPIPLPDPPQITLEQLLKHVHKPSPYKAHGPDDIPNIVLQQCASLIQERLIRIFQAILNLDLYYDPWREFTTVVLRKPSKPSYTVPKAYRPIALLSTMAKALTSLVAEIISDSVEIHQLLPKTHFGGRPGRTTTDAIHYLVHKIKAAWREDQVASILFLDVEGAFPNAVTKRLIHNLKKRRISGILVRFIGRLLTNRRTRMRFDDYISDSIDINNGIGQGDPLSMLLYIIYNADLLEIIGNDLKEDAIGYVDDIAIITTGNDFEESTNRLKTIMTKDDGGLQWSRDHNSRFEVSKSVVMHFSRKTRPDPDSEQDRIPLEKPRLTLEGQEVQETNCFKYLGVQIDSQLRWKEQAQRATANATKWTLQYRRLTRPSTGVSPKLMRQLYLSVALPKITYGLDVWYIPPNKPAGFTKNSGSVGVLHNLQKIQRLATTAITGTLRSSPTDLIDAHSGLFPMELALMKACHRSLVRTLTLPDTHPLHKIVRQARRHPPEKHLSPLDQLIKIFKLRNTKIEVIDPVTRYVAGTNRFVTIVATSREESIISENNDIADYKVFSDGSGQEEDIGASAVLYKKGSVRTVASLQAFLGPKSKHNTYEAEVIGAILATWIIRRTPETIGKTVSLYIDNQAVIKALTGSRTTAGQHLVNSLRLAANDLPCNLEVRWISSHSEVKGNEEADRLAKAAAQGRSSRAVDLPHLLRSPLPVSASAIKQEFSAKLNRLWSKVWDESPRKDRFLRLDPDFPFVRFRKRLFQLTRKQASIIMQLRTGHIPLNFYLKRIGKVDSDRCTNCPEGPDRIQVPETTNHFLFECQAHDEFRRELIAKIGRSHLSLSKIMKHTNYIKALVTYISRTGRFREHD
jgi:ribonuclease HI/endonuclease/exonuclease/phosphatase family metal-dependent hydrolase